MSLCDVPSASRWNYLNASHIHAFSKGRLLKKMGKLTYGEMAEMDRALRQMLDL